MSRTPSTSGSSGGSLRILRVAGSVYPEVPGGVGLHVHHLSRVQADMGHEVTVLTSDNGQGRLPRTETRDGYRLVRYHELARPFDNSLTPTAVAGLARRIGNYDVLHTHSHLHFISNVAAVCGGFSDVPVLVTNHGVTSQTAPDWLQKVHFVTVGRGTFDAADRVLCYTETDRDRLRSRGITAPISVVPNGIDCTRFRPDPAVEPADQLLFVGRLKRGKGVDSLLDAFAIVSRDRPETTLKLVGDGPRREPLIERAKAHGVLDRVEFTGYLPNAELAEVYNESTVFVLPSLSEGLPRTVLEAMACGVPVVTTNLPQLEPVVADAGFTVPPGNADAISSKVETLLEEPSRRERMGERGRRRVREQYSWEDTVAGTTRCCAELAATDRAGRDPIVGPKADRAGDV